jgi:hypothetical protein
VQYRYNGSHPISIPALGLELKPGDTFESDEKLNHSDIEQIKAKPADKTPAKETK